MNNKPMKPVSSPGRSDKYPPPLMRFLRTNVGSKSRRRSRSRATPLFFRKKNTLLETTHEPSSPKVTCIGQVVVRRSHKNKTKNNKTTAAAATGSTSHRRRNHHRICRCLRKLKPTSFFTVWSKWVSFFRCGCRENSGDLHVSPPASIEDQEKQEKQEKEQEKEESVTVRERGTINHGLISLSPKNRILLTRCRSATYTTSSSLGSVFRESRLMEAVGGEEEEVVEEVAGKMKVLVVNEKEVEDGGVNEGSGELKGVKVSPLILSRCKSEPARTWDRILA
ncbi:hypothetical protein SSX86_009206 [Deinandra increscens subsp. villosa]|uniref:Uncharacterized protein n=1 Tax=Deinandra increscens subsp. villosa TaxID=3103831 RepID=A0AAP0DE52_9ASTR